MRVLNADLLVLWVLVTKKFKGIFWAKEHAGNLEEARTPPMLRLSILVFVSCLLGRYVLLKTSDGRGPHHDREVQCYVVSFSTLCCHSLNDRQACSTEPSDTVLGRL